MQYSTRILDAVEKRCATTFLANTYIQHEMAVLHIYENFVAKTTPLLVESKFTQANTNRTQGANLFNKN